MMGAWGGRLAGLHKPEHVPPDVHPSLSAALNTCAPSIRQASGHLSPAARHTPRGHHLPMSFFPPPDVLAATSAGTASEIPSTQGTLVSGHIELGHLKPAARKRSASPLTWACRRGSPPRRSRRDRACPPRPREHPGHPRGQCDRLSPSGGPPHPGHRDQSSRQPRPPGMSGP